MAAFANADKKQFRRRGLVTNTKEGAVCLIPTKIVASYRFKENAAWDGTSYPVPELKVWGILRDTLSGGSYITQVPAIINSVKDGASLTNPGTRLYPAVMDHADAERYDEVSQVVMCDSNYFITNLVVEILGMEHLARVREIVLFAKPDEVSPEQEYLLYSA